MPDTPDRPKRSPLASLPPDPWTADQMRWRDTPAREDEETVRALIAVMPDTPAPPPIPHPSEDNGAALIEWLHHRLITEDRKQMTEPELIEALAAIEHTRWQDWQKYCHKTGTKNSDGSITLPADCVARWERQIATPYAALSEREKESDREQVYRGLPLIREYAQHVQPEMRT